ncbi:nuclear transcription factor, X-box binding protein, putative [Entamoeba invadens IP1]|uniref:Nuclear transcription factor, X-box binding protein, putative n=1 Tax=Entamoeba invadens IP1 TaxID=370355 RepID=A0A0A1U2J1_ENTIV|nr:nuclear transcription factor, X-box binding protein, putative [Entamoeba invadens IP1]ELP85764.1 nuclear transcription factor, X-box binding protein, putative [Entamoeba invadens IP1]|eukprot:XP_004185110.1 nuclear transcription factor, X-box binding protein, putative [Entamoeba invadens IP1]
MSKAPTPQGIDIMDRLNKQTYECVICMSPIFKFQRIWPCPRCYTVVHFQCVSNWATDKPSWSCPVCRLQFSSPPKPSCYCGKHTDGSRFESAHCCGDICGKLRVGTSCKHPCTAKCHPGPCGPCTAGGKTVTCFCGRNQIQLGCCDEESSRSCGNMCLKPLPCGHVCTALCHSGKCPTCPAKVHKTCYCGRSEKDLCCGEVICDSVTKGYFSCDKVCGRVLSCGNHYCQRPCHSGPCGDCPTPISITKCACGAVHVERRTCLDALPVCHKVCGRGLPCGHNCILECHYGECVCSHTEIKKCPCGAKEFVVKCGEEVPNCDEVCGTLLSCGVHKCQRKCCPGRGNSTSDIHTCFEFCGKTLPCGHICRELCHGKKKCPQCRQVLLTPLTCACGKTQISPPVLCGTQPPQCNYLCEKVRPCGHKSENHKCHFGECPKCTELVEKKCFCGKGRVRVCCYIESASCGEKCLKPMSCGVHFCQRVCHSGCCVEPISVVENSTECVTYPCPYRCGRKKMYCNHLCTLPCHGTSLCPETVCEEYVEYTCKCGKRKSVEKCGGCKAHPYVEKVLECGEECQVVVYNIPERKVKYPLWMLVLLESVGKLGKTFESALREYLTQAVEPSLIISGKSVLFSFFVYHLAQYYNVTVTEMKDKKTTVFTVTRTPESTMATPSLTESLLERRSEVTITKTPFIANVVIQESDGEGEYVIHLTRVSDDGYDGIIDLLKRMRYISKNIHVDWQNFLVFFNDKNAIEYAVKEFKRLGGALIRDDNIVKIAKEINLYDLDKKFTKDGVKFVYFLLSKKFQQSATYTILKYANGYIRNVLSNYRTVFKRVLDGEILKLDLKEEKGFFIKQIDVEVTVSKTLINKNVGKHKDILMFAVAIQIGESAESAFEVTLSRNVRDDGDMFEFKGKVSGQQLEKIRNKSVIVILHTTRRDVIGPKASAQLYFEAKMYPIDPKIKKI